MRAHQRRSGPRSRKLSNLETFYDCQECAEHCSHDSPFVTNTHNNDNNNNNINNNNSNHINSNRSYNSNSNNNSNVRNVCKNNNQFPTKSKSIANRKVKNNQPNSNRNNRTKNLAKNNNSRSNNNSKSINCRNQKNSQMQAKVNNLQAAKGVMRCEGRIDNCLTNANDPSIRRWLSKNCFPQYNNINNNNINRSYYDKHVETPLTPARKRSSLARPVRVHDPYMDRNRDSPFGFYAQQRQQQVMDVQSDLTSEPDYPQHQGDPQRGFNDLVEIRVHEEASTWLPLRLKLGEFFELNLPSPVHKRKRRILGCGGRHSRTMIATMGEKTMKSFMEVRQHSFRDTERLLKVFNINNVDQGRRYNVTKCSVM